MCKNRQSGAWMDRVTLIWSLRQADVRQVQWEAAQCLRFTVKGWRCRVCKWKHLPISSSLHEADLTSAVTVWPIKHKCFMVTSFKNPLVLLNSCHRTKRNCIVGNVDNEEIKYFLFCCTDCDHLCWIQHRHRAIILAESSKIRAVWSFSTFCIHNFQFCSVEIFKAWTSWKFCWYSNFTAVLLLIRWCH